jgi:hypothetical protein
VGSNTDMWTLAVNKSTCNTGSMKTGCLGDTGKEKENLNLILLDVTMEQVTEKIMVELDVSAHCVKN